MVVCQFCGCEPATSFHHLIPRSLRRNKWFRKHFAREQFHSGIDVCGTCHKSIHTFVPSEKELGRHFNTLEQLREHPGLANYLQWRRRGCTKN